MRSLPLTLLASTLAFSLYSTAHAENTEQLICHNGQCWEIGDGIGDECCPFSVEEMKSEARPMKNGTEAHLEIRGVSFNWKQNDHTNFA